MEDKRAYKRFDLKVPARIGIAESERIEEQEVDLTTINISAGGAFLDTKAILPQGTRVKMDFILSIEKLKELTDSQCRIKVKGEVIRSDESGIAVRFDKDYEMIPFRNSIH
jgi:c-di-GMP-binding flagellar brake protein YcgR